MGNLCLGVHICEEGFSEFGNREEEFLLDLKYGVYYNRENKQKSLLVMADTSNSIVYLSIRMEYFVKDTSVQEIALSAQDHDLLYGT